MKRSGFSGRLGVAAWLAFVAAGLRMAARCRHVAATGEQRRGAVVCLLHDLRPHDHAATAQRAHCLRLGGGAVGLWLAIPAVQAARADRGVISDELDRAPVEQPVASKTI